MEIAIGMYFLKYVIQIIKVVIAVGNSFLLKSVTYRPKTENSEGFFFYFKEIKMWTSNKIRPILNVFSKMPRMQRVVKVSLKILCEIAGVESFINVYFWL